MSFTFIRFLVSQYFYFFGLAPSISSIPIESLMNFGGVGGLYSTLDSLYTGSKGFAGGLVVWNLIQLGLDFSMSALVKLYSGLFSSIQQGRQSTNVVTYRNARLQGTTSRYPSSDSETLAYSLFPLSIPQVQCLYNNKGLDNYFRKCRCWTQTYL